jgi:hypothetical protein
VNIQDFAPIPPAELKRIRWLGKRAYRVLSHSFAVRWNGNLNADLIEYVWGGFAVPDDDGAEGKTASGNGRSLYSLIDLGPEAPRRYRLLLGDQQVISSHSSDDVLNNLLWQVFRRMHEQTKEFLLIHAGSVVSPHGEAVLLPAGSGFGKTTLVAGLVQAGFGFLSDEIGVIDHDQGVLRPYPRAMNFKEKLPSVFSNLDTSANASARSDGYVRAEEIRPDVMAAPCPVRFVIAPRYMRGMSTQITPLTPAAIVKELWANTVNLHLYGARAVPILVNIARQGRGYSLVSGDLREAVDAISDVTGALGTISMSDFST